MTPLAKLLFKTLHIIEETYIKHFSHIGPVHVRVKAFQQSHNFVEIKSVVRVFISTIKCFTYPPETE